VRPGGREHRQAIEEFAKKGRGWMSALSDSRLILLRRWIDPDEAEVEVRSFAEIVRSVARALGLSLGQLASTGMVRACIAEACRTQSLPEILARSAPFPGTQKALAQTLRELHHGGFDAADLGALAQQAQGPLRDKLSSLAILDERVNQLLESMGREQSLPALRACIEWTAEAALPVKRLLVDASASLEPISAEWLLWAAGRGIEVTVLLEHAASGGFELSQKMASCFGIPPPPPPSPLWVDTLFGTFDQASDPPEITILNAADKLAECECALRTVQRWQHEGVASGEIQIFARDTDTYAPLLLAAARRLGVQLEANLRAPLFASGFVGFTLRLLKAIDSPRLIGLAECATTTFLGEAKQIADQLLAHDAASIQAEADPWETLDLETLEAPDWLDSILRWRKTVLAEPRLLRDWLDHLIHLIGDLPALQSHRETAEREARARSALQRALRDTAVTEQARLEQISYSSFVAHCERIWQSEEMTLPATSSGTRLVTTAEAVQPCQKLIILGMLEGSLPRRRREDPILDDADRTAIRKIRLNLPALLDSHVQAREERSDFIRLAASVTDELILSYPLTSDSQDNVPTYYLSLIEERFQNSVQRWTPRVTELAPPPDQCLNPSDLQISLAMGAPVQNPLNYLVTERAIQIASLPRPAEITPHEIRDALQCPFRAAASHRLGWKSFPSPSYRSLLASLPERINMPARPLSKLPQLLTQQLELEIQQRRHELSPWQVSLLRLALRPLIENWVKKETIERHILRPDRTTTRVHVPLDELGDGGQLDPQLEVTLRGRVAAVTQTRDERPLISTFRSSKGSELSLEKLLEKPDDLIDLIRLFPAIPNSTRGAFFSIDRMMGKRVWIELGVKAPPLAEQDAPHIRRLALTDLQDVQDMRDKIEQTVQAAVLSLRPNPMRATPGEACRTCRWGEHCRLHQEFGMSAQVGGSD